MFNSIAKRQLEKEVARLVLEKGFAWCLQSQLVQTDLLRGFPKQQENVEALSYVVSTAVVAYLMSLPEPEADEAALSRAVERARQQITDEKTAQWAVRCWAVAVSSFSHANRVGFLQQVKAEAEARRQGFANEEERRRHLIECWRLAFPKELAAINKAAELAAQSQVRAASAQMKADNPGYRERYAVMTLGSFGVSDYGKEKTEENPEFTEIKRFAAEQKPMAIKAEIWRRIDTAPDQEAMHLKLKEAWQAELPRRQAKAEQQRIQEEQRRQMQSEETERRRVFQVEEAERRRASQVEEAKRRRIIDAENEKRTKIREWRNRFPLQCAGFNDEEILLQITESEEGKK